MFSTNYYNTFIQVPSTCTRMNGIIPSKNINAQLQFDLLFPNPCEFTSDELLFLVFAKINDIFEEDLNFERKKFFFTPVPCLRYSPLVTNFGWGIHCNHDGFIAMYGKESEEYNNCIFNNSIQKIEPIHLYLKKENV